MLKFYPSVDAYLYAFADALHEEYRAIADAGLILQVDLASSIRVGSTLSIAPTEAERTTRGGRASRSSITRCGAFPRSRCATTTAGAA